jgi:Cft2 family RNA processing exonuclease
VEERFPEKTAETTSGSAAPQADCLERRPEIGVEVPSVAVPAKSAKQLAAAGAVEDDTSTPDERPAPGLAIDVEATQPQTASLGPAYALLKAFFRDRIPDGRLGADTVPSDVLDLPIAIATDALVDHLKHCHKPHCPYIPPPLQAYRRMRPNAIRNAKEQVHKVLWTYPTHELVIWVRKEILDKHSKLANEISTGELLARDRLGEALNEMGPIGPHVLAAVLWATEFNGPCAEVLFRSLVPIIQAEIPQNGSTDRLISSDSDQAKSVKAKLRAAIRERERAKQLADQAKDELQSKERALDKLRRELQEAQRDHRELTEVFDRVERRLRETEAAYRSLELDIAKTSKVNSALRKDLRDTRQERADLEISRSDLALQLATERRSIEQLKLQLAAVPTGADAVKEFLRVQEDRIQISRTITAGGDRARAEDEWRAHRKLENAFLDAYPEFRNPRRAAIAPKTSLGLVALGGSSEVGRSCYLVELGKHRILVDCGIRPDTREDSYPDIDMLDRPDALVLTHAHTDHIGWVPALVRRFPDVSIYCSEATAALLPVMLEDCYQHYTRKIEAERKRRQYIANARPVHEAYDARDVHAVSKLVISCIFNQKETLPFGGISLRFCPAGHVLGAASVLIQDLSGPRVFFSGDFASFPQLTIPAADWPDDIGYVDLLVLESTYGGKDAHKPLQSSRTELIGFARKTLEGNGSLILASFGLGRAQELLKLLATAQDDGELPPVTVYVDGMIKRINPIYRKWASFEISTERFYEVSGDTDRQDVAAVAQMRPSIIVTTSGMLTGGPVLHYAKHLLANPQNRIVLTGYQDEGAPSRVLKETAIGRRVVVGEDENGHKVEFEAAMPAKEIGLSAHADQPGLLEYAAKLRPRHIALVHGEPTGQQALRYQLLKTHPKSAIVCGPDRLSDL